MAFLKFLIASVIVAAAWAGTACEPQLTTVAAGEGYEWAECNMGGASSPDRLITSIKVSPTGDYNLGVGMCIDMCECTTGCAGILYHAGDHTCSGYGTNANCTPKAPASSGACYAMFMRTAGAAAPTDGKMGSCIMKTRRTADENGYAKLASASENMVSCFATARTSKVEVSGRDNFNDNNVNAQQCEAKCETLPGCQMFTHATPNATEHAGRCHYFTNMCTLSLYNSCNEVSTRCSISGLETYLRVAGPSEVTLAPTPTSSPTNSGADGSGTHTSPTPTPPTPAPPAPAVSVVTMTLENVDHAALIANTSLQTAFEGAIKESVASAAGASILPAHVAVALSSGSVVAVATVTPPAGSSTTATALSATLAADAQLASNVATAVSGVPGITLVVDTGATISVSGVSATTVEATPMPTPMPTPAPDNEPMASTANKIVYSQMGMFVGTLPLVFVHGLVGKI